MLHVLPRTIPYATKNKKLFNTFHTTDVKQTMVAAQSAHFIQKKRKRPRSIQLKEQRSMTSNTPALQTDPWLKTGRANQQIPSGDAWKTWLILAGRGFGKTRTGAETVRQWVQTKKAKRVALISNTEQDVRQVMIEGESGLLNVHCSATRPRYQASLGTLVWKNGAQAHVYSAEAYEKLRGPQFDAAWIDELAKFRNAQQTWDQLMMALRLGQNPRVVVTTTPKPINLIESLVKDETVHLTRGTTFDNAQNLSPSFLNYIKKKYESTQLGAQELYGEILTTRTGALWQRDMIQYKAAPSVLQRIIIGVDPAVSVGATADETGIIVAGVDSQNNAYVLADYSGKYSPYAWSQKVIQTYHHFNADCVVVEKNQGGDIIGHMLKSQDVTVNHRLVTASRGKHVRAEPVVSLYEQKKVFHVQRFTTLENQLCHYVPWEVKYSPDRLDALVWALTELMLKPISAPKIWHSGRF